MKNFKSYIAYLAMFALLFTSCSKEESGEANLDSEKATLSFGAIINDLTTRAASKGHLADIPECTNDTPFYVEIVLMQGDNYVVGTSDDPYRVNLAPGQIFTVEDAALELTPGNYMLDYFAVYNEGGDLIWIAPKTGASLASYVDHPLPMAIDLRAGVKKYVDVSVLCFDDRVVNEYGYQFFELDLNRAIEFCMFANYCDSTGRHYPGQFSVNVWSYANGQRGSQLYNSLSNTVTMNDAGDFAGSPLCIALPDTDGMDEYYFEITLMDSDAYGDVENRVVREGVLTDEQVRDFFSGEDEVDYLHLRFGCDNIDSAPVFMDPASQSVIYTSTLSSLNDSGASATAFFEFKDNKMIATVMASGLTPNRRHPQYIHGFTDGKDATCPPESAANDDPQGDDRFISLEEGVPFYGPVLLPLRTPRNLFPKASQRGSYVSQRVYDMTTGSLPSPESLAVVIHGRMVDGEYMPSLPVACGEVIKE